MPDFDEEMGVLAAIEEDETVEVEIELKEEEPAFLKGYGRQSLQVRSEKRVKCSLARITWVLASGFICPFVYPIWRDFNLIKC